LRAVHITPDGNLVVIAGRNAQGKSSVLDSIMYALAGGNSLPAKPVRHGAEKGLVELDLGDLLVKRTFSANGNSSLSVTDMRGRVASPQALLDSLMGKMSFDPLEFSRQKPEVQADTLRKLVGLDTTVMDAKKEALYFDRTVVGREVKAFESQLALQPFDPAVPMEEVSTVKILNQQREAMETNARNQSLRNAAIEAGQKVVNCQNAALMTADKIREIEAELTRLKAWLREQEEVGAAAELAERAAAIAGGQCVDIKLDGFALQITEANAVNVKVAQQAQRKGLALRLSEKRKAQDDLSRQIEAIEEAKRQAVAEAKFPVAGLAFDQLGGVTFAGIPFAQCSTAEQLRVSVAIGLALNPKLRVLLIRDGSLLDQDSLKAVADMATAADAQVWIERVEVDGNVSVIIDDGMVSGAAVEAPKESQLL